MIAIKVDKGFAFDFYSNKAVELFNDSENKEKIDDFQALRLNIVAEIGASKFKTITQSIQYVTLFEINMQIAELLLKSTKDPLSEIPLSELNKLNAKRVAYIEEIKKRFFPPELTSPTNA